MCKASTISFKKILPSKGNSARIHAAMQLVKNKNGNKCSVNELCAHLDISRKSLNQHFRRHVGMSASGWLQQSMFSKVLTYINQSPGKRLIEAAYEHHFFDQSHFIRQFQQYAGMNPRAYLDYVLDKKVDSLSPSFISL